MYDTTLATMEQVLGKEHDYTLTTKHKYAATLMQFNKSRAAEGKEMLLEVIAVRKRILGTDHPFYLSSRAALAQLLCATCNQGQCKEALPILRECYKSEKNLYHVKHPSVLATASSIGLALTILGRSDPGYFDEAETILKETLKLEKEVRGAEHPLTKQTAEILRQLYTEMSRWTRVVVTV